MLTTLMSAWSRRRPRGAPTPPPLVSTLPAPASTPAPAEPALAAQPPPPALTPAVRKPPRPLHVAPPEAHARALLDWLTAEDGPAGQDLSKDDVQQHYLMMCLWMDWQERPWNPVGKHFNLLLGGKKTYRYVKQASGPPKKLRVYRIPKAAEAAPGPAVPPPVIEMRRAA